MAGEEALPDIPPSADLKGTFGAVGDGVADDTPAFLAALDAVSDAGVVYLPPGKYLITKKLDISKRVVFKGAGRGLTTLVFNSSLTQLQGNTMPGGSSQYTYGPALLNFWGVARTDSTTLLGRVSRNATRGDTRLYVAGAPLKFAVDTWVRLLMDNPADNSLVDDLGAGLITPSSSLAGKTRIALFVAQVCVCVCRVFFCCCCCGGGVCCYVATGFKP